MTKEVAIDIGHGSDTFPPNKGVYIGGKGYAEHDFNSKVGVELDKLLKHNGFKTVMKQKPFSPDVGLTTRTNYYNSKGVDLVWSIHANANGNKNVDGRCAFYWHTAKDSKKLAELYVDECKKAGYDVHGNGLHASKPNNWTDLHICRETAMTAVLTENGFMTNDEPGKNDDFELIFGSKQKQYVKDMARVHAKAICRYYGVNFKDLDGTTVADKPSKPSKPNPNKGSYNGNSVVEYLNHKKIDSSFRNRAKLAKLYGVKGYKGTASQNTELLNKLKKGKPVSKPSKSIKVGSKVYLSKGAKKYVTGENIPSSIKGKTYTVQQVKRNKVLLKEIYSWVYKSDVGGSGKSSKQKSKSFSPGQKVTVKKSASTFATGESIADFVKGNSYTVKQVKSDRVLLGGIMSWVRKLDVY
ncbi:N-acetylmuramoyl-L-alanine amidase family protein [Virgibacillus dokdonensis]|uniref:N-acetylmuramoyl-L-alanine amidase family protein n=1 Tax=Virgibacillus dokdonensis TaxID=302167 RepID=UPI000989B5B7|nr:N-acetylmuramoyl-L-alanine amidase [Virgibacillus dokdonensis]